MRQGNPLSLLSFITVSNVLSKMISKAKVDYISGFMTGYGISRISHLQFVDDTMIFCEADMMQLSFLRCIMCCFEAYLRLKINPAKSELFQN